MENSKRKNKTFLNWFVAYFDQLTQSKSKTQITRSVHGKFNCITVKYNGTRHGIYPSVTSMPYGLCPGITQRTNPWALLKGQTHVVT